uniref:Uncharacterized protein n=1 Tax=Ixodes ricinus TaxID=34613 RepID=A0A147BII3_IXORI
MFLVAPCPSWLWLFYLCCSVICISGLNYLRGVSWTTSSFLLFGNGLVFFSSVFLFILFGGLLFLDCFFGLMSVFFLIYLYVSFFAFDFIYEIVYSVCFPLRVHRGFGVAKGSIILFFALFRERYLPNLNIFTTFFLPIRDTTL